MNAKRAWRVMDLCKRCLYAIIGFGKFIVRFNGMVIVAKLPHSEHEKTGYYYRILAIDDIVADIPVVYADWNPAPEQPDMTYGFSASGKQSRTVYNVTSLSRRLLALLCLLRCRKVYFHHVASIFSEFKLSVRLPFITSFIDFHGAAPEEHELAGFYDKVALMERLERFSLNHVSHCIVVTKVMQNHLAAKYDEDLIRERCILLPIIQSAMAVFPEKTIRDGKYAVVYAGNAQRWQQIPQMLKAIVKTAGAYHYKLCCTDPSTMNALLPHGVSPSIRAVAVVHEDLLNVYASCHFGFVLREDSVVNRVACPTKLVEYLAYGIVPVVDTPHIGDFCTLGMRYVTLEALEQGALPTEEDRLAFTRNNRAVFEQLRQRYLSGCGALRKIINGTEDSMQTKPL